MDKFIATFCTCKMYSVDNLNIYLKILEITIATSFAGPVHLFLHIFCVLTVWIFTRWRCNFYFLKFRTLSSHVSLFCIQEIPHDPHGQMVNGIKFALKGQNYELSSVIWVYIVWTLNSSWKHTGMNKTGMNKVLPYRFFVVAKIVAKFL